ncbi:MAG: hypothetical protein IKP71_05025 [Candidatus Riflebacteria bacterium]|nr:hypothetical protein [Candidatus Riflebacteria bacterium]
MTFGLYLILFCFLIFICAFLFDRYKKEKRKEYIYNFIVIITICGILFAMAIPNSFHNNSNKYLDFCYKAQRILVNAIDIYNIDNKDNLFPQNCNNSEIEKYQKELLLKNKYLKEQVYPTRYCSFEIKDSELFCIEHGSCDPNSKYYTKGSPVKGYENFTKDNDSFRAQITKMNEKEKERYFSLIVAFVGLVVALKYFIFVLM